MGSQIILRRYDLDWLRIILFLILIEYHYLHFSPPALMFDPSRTVLNFFLYIIHQWRLAALFMISGMATSFAFQSRTWKQYIKERYTRLLVPFLFGVYILNGGIQSPLKTTGHLLALFPNAGVTGHFWFLFNLMIYSVALTPLFEYIRNQPNSFLMRLLESLFEKFYGLGILIIPSLLLALIAIPLKPWMLGSNGRWWEFPWYLLFFTFGYLLIAKKEFFFVFLDRMRFVLTVLTPVFVLVFYLSEKIGHFPEMWFGGWIQDGYPAFSLTATIGTFVQAFHAWIWCLFIFSWAAKLFNKPSKTLTYLNQAIYPVFIVHQPMIYVIIILFRQTSLNKDMIDFILGPLLVLGCSLLIFEIVKRTQLSRFFFGIKSTLYDQNLKNKMDMPILGKSLILVLVVLIVLLLNWGRINFLDSLFTGELG